MVNYKFSDRLNIQLIAVLVLIHIHMLNAGHVRPFIWAFCVEVM